MKLVLAAAAGFAALLWAATGPIEQYKYTSDGRILIDRDFVQNRASYTPFIQFLELVAGYLPEANLSYDYLQQHALWRCGTANSKTYSNYSNQALQALTRAFEVDKPPLTKLGRWMAHENFVGALCTQLALSELERTQPHIFTQTEIKAVVIAGPPRTGSTHLLSTLCKHPNATCLTFAEATDPIAPTYLRPNQLLTFVDYRLWKNAFAAMLIQQLRPLFPSMQKFAATTPMEEILLGSLFFGSSVLATNFPLPTYDKWFRETDHTEMELGVKKLLQVIQYQRGGDAKMWVLKSPQNANQLHIKTKVYPEAQFVFTHRKALPVIQSLAGMLSYVVGVFCDAKKMDYNKFVEGWIGHQQWSQERILPELVAKHLTPKQVMHVYFDEFMKQPVEMCIRVAQHAGLPADEQVNRVFAKFQLDSPQAGSKVLKYDLESFGVSKQSIESRFEKYEVAYGLR